MDIFRPFIIHFTCPDCGAVYAATRTRSDTDRAYRVFCPDCKDGVLHEGNGRYSLSDWEPVLSRVRWPEQQ